MNGNKKKDLWHNKGLRAGLYILSIVLAAFYIVVLWWGKHPEVGIEYKMYYITHELSDWPGFDNLSYKNGTREICTELKNQDGTKVDYTVCRRKGIGWQKKQYEGSVNKGTSSYIYYIPELSDEGEYSEYSIELNDFEGTGMVSVYINDELAGMCSKAGSYTFKTKPIVKDELVTVKFVADNCEFRLWSAQLD